MTWLRQLDRENPFVIRDCGGATIELLFLGPIADPEKLATQIERLCSDASLENGRAVVGVNPIVRRLQQERRVRLWWD